jgi:hypothetical protein
MTDAIIIRKLPPVWFIRALNGFRSGLTWLNGKLFPSSVVLYERFLAFWFLPALRVAAEMDIAGILNEGPKNLQELAERTGTDPEALFRMLRALASQKVFKRRKDGRYINTSLSKVLIEGRGSLRYMVMQHLGTINWTVFNELSYSIKSGKSAFSNVYGKKIYDFLSENPVESTLFDRSMTNLTQIGIEPFLSAYNFSKCKTIADIGGGEGLLLASILYQNKNAQGVLFDLPEGLNNAEVILKKYGVRDRVQVIPGNFFDTAPAGFETYLLKNILHNWGDAECVSILSNIRSSMDPQGRILILEMILDEGNNNSIGKLLDLQMMVFMEHGKERTSKEFEQLLEGSGLKTNRIYKTIAPFSIIEAVKK